MICVSSFSKKAQIFSCSGSEGMNVLILENSDLLTICIVHDEARFFILLDRISLSDSKK